MLYSGKDEITAEVITKLDQRDSGIIERLDRIIELLEADDGATK